MCRMKSVASQSNALCLPRLSTHILALRLTLQQTQSSTAFQFKSRRCSTKAKVKEGLLQPQPPLAYWCVYLNVSCVCIAQGQAAAAGMTTTHAAHIWLKHLLGSQRHMSSLRLGLCVLHSLPGFAKAVTDREHLLSFRSLHWVKVRGCCPSF